MSTDTMNEEDKDTTPEWVVNLWEKVTDGVSAFFDGAGKFLTRMMGSSNERYVRQLGYIRPNKPGAEPTVTPGSISLIRATIGRIRRICRSLELPKSRTNPSETVSVIAVNVSEVIGTSTMIVAKPSPVAVHVLRTRVVVAPAFSAR